MNPTLFDIPVRTGPQVRRTDGTTSRDAQKHVAPGNSELIYAIRWYVARRRQPVSAFDIADGIAGVRWSHASVRTAVSRAQLVVADEDGLSPRGRKIRRYRLDRP